VWTARCMSSQLGPAAGLQAQIPTNPPMNTMSPFPKHQLPRLKGKEPHSLLSHVSSGILHVHIARTLAE
jgi:hypothetical protein